VGVGVGVGVGEGVGVQVAVGVGVAHSGLSGGKVHAAAPQAISSSQSPHPKRAIRRSRMKSAIHLKGCPVGGTLSATNPAWAAKDGANFTASATRAQPSPSLSDLGLAIGFTDKEARLLTLF